MENAKYFLGLELTRSDSGLFINQCKYVLDLLEDAGMINCKPVAIPMHNDLRLNSKEGELMGKPKKYRRLVCRLLYLGFTRPNIA